MALTDEQRGPRAAWLRRHRVTGYGSGDGGLVKLSEALRGIGLDRSWQTLKGWESSDERSPIPADALPYLERLFSDHAPHPTTPVATSELIAALRDQTTALNGLVAAIQSGWDVRLAAVEASIALLNEPSVEGSPAPELPRVEAGSGR